MASSSSLLYAPPSTFLKEKKPVGKKSLGIWISGKSWDFGIWNNGTCLFFLLSTIRLVVFHLSTNFLLSLLLVSQPVRYNLVAGEFVTTLWLYSAFESQRLIHTHNSFS